MHIRCIAIDDEPLALEMLKGYIQHFPALKLLQTFDDAISATEYLRNNAIDLLFIDINMPDITGIDLVRSLKQKPMLVFTTAHKKFAVEGFDLEALDYLLKPIQLERFAKTVNKAMSYFQNSRTAKTEVKQNLFVRAEYQLVKIDLDEIEYIESVEDYLKIHLTGTRPVMTLMTIKAVLQKLPPTQFKRIHRSYVVPLSKIRSVVNRKVRLTEVELPVSDSYADFINEWKSK